MQASRPVSLPVSVAQNGKENRSYLLVGPEESFLGNGNTQFRITGALLAEAVKIALSQSDKAGGPLDKQK